VPNWIKKNEKLSFSKAEGFSETPEYTKAAHY